MDLECQNELSAFLKKGQRDRTVLILTQHLKEAHLLGNRFSVLSGGTLQCCGSLDFLNDRFGECLKYRNRYQEPCYARPL